MTISYQLYSSRKFGPLTDTLRMLADLGYDAAEGYGALYADDAATDGLAGALKETGLAMPSGHVGLDMCRDRAGRVLDIAKTLGTEYVIIPHLKPEERPADAAGWTAFGKSLAEIGKPFRDAGLTFGYHNHDFELRPTGSGEMPLDLILAGDPDLVLEFDVAWGVRAGVDPMTVIEKHGARLKAAHMKDIAPAGQATDEDGWADPGHGTMDWPALSAAIAATGCDLIVMEHDNPSDDARFARHAIASAKGMGVK